MAASGIANRRVNVVQGSRRARLGLRTIGVGYLLLLLVIPVLMVFVKAFEDGIANAWETITSPEGMHAFWLTLVMVAVSVPLNTIFGVVCAIVLVRHKFRGKALINSLIDLPFAISPVVVGLALVLVFNQRDGWFGPWLAEQGIRVLFTPIGMVIATVFVSMPFVVREVVPVLQEIGDDQEQAARTLGANGWQTFWRVTLPSIRWGVTYGVVLSTARALGEFGAVAVVSGKISGVTETLPLYVSKQYETFNVSGAYAAAVVLALVGLATLFAMNLIERGGRRRDQAITNTGHAPTTGPSQGEETP
ncbi:MAG TPA: sulfate ABC transporter permease subunit CysW [Solirubrobacterales bacterium]